MLDIDDVRACLLFAASHVRSGDGIDVANNARGPAPEVRTGNAVTEASAHRGWFVGHFIDADADPRSTSALELKWGAHAAGEGQDEWSANAVATTLSLLIQGRDRISFPDGDVVLSRPGDYVIWPPGVPHRWKAEENAIVLTVRWPSRVGDNATVADGTDHRPPTAPILRPTDQPDSTDDA